MAESREISRSFPLRGWLMRKVRRGAVALAIGGALALSIRAVVAEEFYATSNAVAPEVRQGGRVVVYKLASAFQPEDVVVYRDPTGNAYLARVVAVGAAPGRVTVARNREAARTIGLDQVVGRVVLATR